MYSLTLCVRLTTPPFMLSPVRVVFAGMRSVRVRHACAVRWAWRVTAGLCHAFSIMLS